jgi:hypothetical protein
MVPLSLVYGVSGLPGLLLLIGTYESLEIRLTASAGYSHYLAHSVAYLFLLQRLLRLRSSMSFRNKLSLGRLQVSFPS